MSSSATSVQTVAPGITRVERGQSKGYVVRLSRDGVRTSEYYADRSCGGKRAALRCAKERHAELVAELGPPAPSRKGKLTDRNQTGKVGVHLAYSVDNRYPDCEYYAYCASWKSEDGKRKKISFAFNRYGEDEAWELACIARDQENNNRDDVMAIRERQLKRKTRKKRRQAK